MVWQPVKSLIRQVHKNRHVRKAKDFRNALVEGYFRSRHVAQGSKLAEELRRTGSRHYCFAIAFNTPWVIDALTKAWLTYSTGMTLVVVDNSSSRSARQAIETICRSRGIVYFGLPRNPEWNPNRSHGISMNWIFHNIVRHLRPETFGYLDHDCFPVAPLDIPRCMEGKAAYGAKHRAERGHDGWYFWAGLCFFRYAAVEDLDLDFRPRFETGLDTGGGNWPMLRDRLDENNIVGARGTTVSLRIGETEAHHQMFDGSLFHVGGASYRALISTRRYRRLMSDHLWDTYLGGVAGRLVNDL
ncbi:hypothetical protein LHFGNBLO_002508 [Mesorhizobium sp. AR10]|uniref:hypothetical protein n=1 Tax=Mesorhizobium sp. AR10 TaxID=2865839 RepID=UPI00215FBD48|nr:hypothetical protein [Mesorhizobium sp. AR10]UVK40969.1 hypothetical protein LHFGNBLO_002508 [Mesorhizobium sp. AR10]